jgi:hypothetical protein
VIVDGPRAGIYRLRIAVDAEDQRAIEAAVAALRQEDEVIAFVARAPSSSP